MKIPSKSQTSFIWISLTESHTFSSTYLCVGDDNRHRKPGLFRIRMNGLLIGQHSGTSSREKVLQVSGLHTYMYLGTDITWMMSQKCTPCCPQMTTGSEIWCTDGTDANVTFIYKQYFLFLIQPRNYKCIPQWANAD